MLKNVCSESKLGSQVVVLARGPGVGDVGLSPSVGVRRTGRRGALLTAGLILAALVFALLLLVGRILLTFRTRV